MHPKSPALLDTLSAAEVRAKHKEYLFPATTKLRISPPLTVNAAEVDEAIGKLDESYGAIGA